MSRYFLSVSRTARAVHPRPCLHFAGDWLNDMGFVPGALVQALPESDGMIFNLCNENIGLHSDLFHATRSQNGGLVRVGVKNVRGHKVPTFVTSGKYIYNGGLAMGDVLIAKYVPGMIRVRKIDPHKLGFEHVRITAVSTATVKYTDAPVPKIRFCGDWLNDIGFAIDTIATAASEPGTITLELQDANTEYNALMKYLRGRKMKIVQVSKETHNRGGQPQPCIGITGSCVEKAGFEPGEMLVTAYEQGKIKIQRLDFEKLGF